MVKEISRFSPTMAQIVLCRPTAWTLLAGNVMRMNLQFKCIPQSSNRSWIPFRKTDAAGPIPLKRRYLENLPSNRGACSSPSVSSSVEIPSKSPIIKIEDTDEDSNGSFTAKTYSGRSHYKLQIFQKHFSILNFVSWFWNKLAQLSFPNFSWPYSLWIGNRQASYEVVEFFLLQCWIWSVAVLKYVQQIFNP